MNIERALRVRRDMITRVIDAYSSARSFCLRHSELDRRVRDAMKCPPKTPLYIREYVSGYRQALSDQLYRDALVHGGMFEGVFYSTHSNRDDYYEKHGMTARDYADDGRVTERGHYWIANVSRPFFTHSDWSKNHE